MGWIASPIIPRRQWPKVRYAAKKAITEEQYLQIIDREQNPEKLAFYQLLWHLGGSQTDIATLTAEAIDWTNRTVNFPRKKNQQTCAQRFGDECAAVLEKLPKQGLLLPSIARLGEGDRASYFTLRCKTLGISGVSLHSLRYSWAEQAAAVGMPERFAMLALGHKSRAVGSEHREGTISHDGVCPSETFGRDSLRWRLLTRLNRRRIYVDAGAAAQ